MTKGIEIKPFDGEEEEKVEDEDLQFDETDIPDEQPNQKDDMDVTADANPEVDGEGKHKSGFTKQYLNYMVD